MKNIFLILAIVFSAASAFSQSETYYPSPRMVSKIDTFFPFDVPLKTPDSTFISSNQIMKKGRVTVMAFWLTTCYPCMIEFQEYTKNWEAWKKEADFDFVAISTDFPKNWKAFVGKKGAWPWPIVLDYNREFSSFLKGGLNGLPQVFLYDQKGQLAYHHRKFSMGDDKLLFEEIKKLMPAK